MDDSAGELECFSEFSRTGNQTNSNLPGSSLCSHESTVVANEGLKSNVKQSLPVLGTSVLLINVECEIQSKNQDCDTRTLAQVSELNPGDTFVFSYNIPRNQGIARSNSSEGSSQKCRYTPRKRKYDYEGPPLEDKKEEKRRQKAIRTSQWREKNVKNRESSFATENRESSFATENPSSLQISIKPSLFLKFVPEDGIETSGELGKKDEQLVETDLETTGGIRGTDSTNANVQVYEHTEKEMKEWGNELLKEIEELKQHKKELKLKNEQAMNKMKEMDQNFELLQREYDECKLREETLEQENKRITVERDQSKKKLQDTQCNLYSKCHSIEAFIKACNKNEHENEDCEFPDK